jgi:NhaA family Na+:H+ antiporter
VAFLVVPIFGFANAGIAIPADLFAVMVRPVPLGIAAGLFLGKQLGVMGASWAAIRLGVAALPAHAGWRRFYGMALLCGIGFTMSLFIGTLAFPDAATRDEVKIGVMTGSLLSGLAGWAVLAWQPRSARPR